MQQLFPTAVEGVDPDDVYLDAARPRRHGRPWVLANMIASADGAAAGADGRSGTLGGAPDRRVFAAVRATPDVILVAAGTVRAEGYGPVVVSDAHRTRRLARGQAAVPALAVVSASLELDLAAPLFTAAERRPIIITCDHAPEARRRRAAEVADVVVAGERLVDVAAAVGALGERGADVVLCEGGPQLLSHLVAVGLIDELCLTLSPQLVGGTATRIVHGPPAAHGGLRLSSVLEEEGFLLLRYRCGQ